MFLSKEPTKCYPEHRGINGMNVVGNAIIQMSSLAKIRIARTDIKD